MIDCIQLDWDSIAYSLAKEQLSVIMDHPNVDGWELYESPGGDGYHAYVYLLIDVLEEESYRLRQMWKDDGKRIVMDVLFRPDDVPHDVLFQKKIGYWPGFTFEETLVEEKWTR